MDSMSNQREQGRGALSPDADPRPARGWACAIVTGVALVCLHVGLVWLSLEFQYEKPHSEMPIRAMVALELVASAVFLLAVWGIRSARGADRTLLTWMIGVGLLLRVIMMVSNPMLEDDYYRYMWDGAILANGVNPYQYAPAHAREGASGVPEQLLRLARQPESVISRVSFPEIRTIYPPVAQVAFSVAYALRPWSLLALRIVLLFFDCATLILVLVVLRSLRLPSALAIVYWWNPLVILQTISAAHPDVIALPFVLAAILLSLRDCPFQAAFMLALAVATKLWPVVLLPVVLFPLRKRPKTLLLSFGLFAAVTALFFLPVYLAGLDSSSGFVSYGRYWEMNDALYKVLAGIIKLITASVSLDGSYTPLIGRTLAILILAMWSGWLLKSTSDAPAQIWERSMLIVAATFLLSPTGFPWYYLWVAPFLAIRPSPSLLLLNCLLPLYYLADYFSARTRSEAFDNVVVWFEYAPFWMVAAWEWLRSRNSSQATII